MKRVILLALIAFVSLSTFAAKNFYQVKLHMNNGVTKIGLATFIEHETGDYVYFKKNSDSEIEKVESIQVNKIIYSFDGKEYEYVYLKVYKGWKQKEIMETPKWAEVVKKGTVTLYVVRTTIEGGVMPASKTSAGFSDFYVMKKGEPAAKIYATLSTANNNQTFRAKAPLYFSDYPELANKIRNKEYTWKNLEEVIDIYNEWAEKNKK